MKVRPIPSNVIHQPIVMPAIVSAMALEARAAIVWVRTAAQAAVLMPIVSMSASLEVVPHRWAKALPVMKMEIARTIPASRGIAAAVLVKIHVNLVSNP